MVHDFDQANWILGEPRRVFARAVASRHEAYPDHVVAIVEYDGAEAVVEGSMAMPASFPFSSLIRVMATAGVAEYAFRAAPAEGGGNIGAVDESARGLRIFPRDGEPEVGAHRSRRPMGPGDRGVRLLRRARVASRRTARAEQALLALRVSLAANRSLASGVPEARVMSALRDRLFARDRRTRGTRPSR